MNKKNEQAKEGISDVRAYFTEAVNKRISEMTSEEMESILKATIDTPEWIAMLKYIGMRTPLLDATMRGTDPVKEPSKITWAQGAMAGLSDLENYVIELNTTKVEEEEVNTNSGPEGKVN